jgi:hypothetical protein
MREYQPFVSSVLEAPSCPACHASRMMASGDEPGATAPELLTFECQSAATFVSRLSLKIQ